MNWIFKAFEKHPSKEEIVPDIYYIKGALYNARGSLTSSKITLVDTEPARSDSIAPILNIFRRILNPENKTSFNKLVGEEYTSEYENWWKNNIEPVNINLPAININGDVVAEFNNTTNKVFSNKVAEVIKTNNKYTIYNIEYVAYLNDNILSVVIKSTLKEEGNAERVRVQTYNYDIEAEKEVTLNDILEQKQITQKSVNKKIEKQVKEAARKAEAVAGEYASQGKLVYERDVNNAMYITDYVNDFFLGKDGQIYIVYAYGNTNHTAEMDVIKVDENVKQ